MENKKTILFRIYLLLEKHSDLMHPIKQQDIIDLLAEKHGINCDRKTVGRNIACLREMGYDIPNVGKDGVYLSTRRLENSEIRLLIDSIMCSKYINGTHSKELIDKLVSFGGDHFRSHIKHISMVDQWDKSDNQFFLYNIEIIDEAIENDKQIEFYYDKQQLLGQKSTQPLSKQIVNPYELYLHNQHYYLVGNNNKYDNMLFYRMDIITEIQLLDSPRKPKEQVDSYSDYMNLPSLASSLPYLFVGETEEIVFRFHNNIKYDVFDRFNGKIKVEADINNEDYSIATIQSTQKAMVYWFQQYCTSTEVLSPIELRETLKANFITALKKYQQ